MAFVSIDNVGKTAVTSSLGLGLEAVDETTTALQTAGEEHLVRIASDQAEVTNVLFEDTDSEMEILAAAATMLPGNPPMIPRIPSFGTTDHPADPHNAVLVPGCRVPGSPRMTGNTRRSQVSMTCLLRYTRLMRTCPAPMW